MTLNIGRQTLPKVLGNVPRLEVGAVVAECIPVARTKCARRIDLRGGAGRGKAPAGGPTTLMVLGESGVVVDHVGGARSCHVGLFIERVRRVAVAVW